MTSIRLVLSSSNSVNLSEISKVLTISSNCRLQTSARQHSIVQALIWSEMNCDANIAAHLSVGPTIQWSTKPHWFHWVFLPVQWKLLNTSIAACLESCKGAECRPTIYSWLVYDILVLHFKRQPFSAGWYVFLYKVRAFRTCL